VTKLVTEIKEISVAKYYLFLQIILAYSQTIFKPVNKYSNINHTNEYT